MSVRALDRLKRAALPYQRERKTELKELKELKELEELEASGFGT